MPELSSISTFIIILAVVVLVLPFMAYMWGRQQASGWIEAFKNSNLTLKHKKDEKEEN